MGMAASQARMLQLTARKSNVEFQGQQINQQRTLLANQSSAYNSQLLTLNVPTAPSISGFTKTAYEFNANGNEYQISNVAYNEQNGTYDISYKYNTTSDQNANGSAIFSRVTNGAGQTTGYTTSNGTNLTKVVLNANEPGYNANAAATDSANLALLYGDNYQTGSYYKYSNGGVTRYLTEADLEARAGSGTNAPFKYVQQDAQLTQTGKITGATVNWNDSGRMVSFTDENGTTYSLTTTTSTDEDLYNDAMNQYEYDKSVYEKEMQDINAKISIIQSQDKKLELQLTQLDTEQSAISTELEAVNKVISKNVETSFKTFNA